MSHSRPSPAGTPDVVVVCQLFHPELISTGQTLTELVEELVRLGLKITVIAAQPTVLPGSKRVDSVIYHEGVTIIRTWSTRFPKTNFIGKLFNVSTFFLSATWRILVDYRQPQLLLLTNPPYLPLLGWFMHVLRRQRFGVLLFDIMPEQAELIEFIKPNGLVARAWRKLNQLWYGRAAYAVVLSSDMLEGALKNANLLGTSAEAQARAKTHVIHVWSDDRLIQGQPKSASKEAQRLGVENKFVVQYSGNHGRFHDIESLFRIAQSFQPDEGVVFQFVGEGQKKKLVNESLKQSPQPHIYSSSYVPKELLADSLSMADLGVVAQLPGQERVCYPSKLLGVMAAGRAALAICPPDCEMARMIRKYELGFVVANGDIEGGRRVLLEAAANPERVRQMGIRAAEHLRAHFTLAQAARGYHSLMTTHARD
ncbi:MAG TPA: glycosyltransferase family 4 protein [Candidatus Limnocylindria bacterium]|nr:glycosyltransferase family 4 protein [Candidatus Limnocylindria bacterium]